jgi:hypothetical protein
MSPVAALLGHPERVSQTPGHTRHKANADGALPSSRDSRSACTHRRGVRHTVDTPEEPSLLTLSRSPDRHSGRCSQAGTSRSLHRSGEDPVPEQSRARDGIPLVALRAIPRRGSAQPRYHLQIRRGSARPFIRSWSTPVPLRGRRCAIGVTWQLGSALGGPPGGHDRHRRHQSARGRSSR